MAQFETLPSGKLRDVAALATAPGNFLEGAVRSAKTVTSLLIWLRWLRELPPGEVAMIGKTQHTLKRNVLDPLVAMVGSQSCKVNMGTGSAKILGRTVYLQGANDESAVAKIQGMTLVAWYGDEMPTWPEAVFNILRTRLSAPGARWIGTGNPASSTHYLKREWIDMARFHMTRDGQAIHRYGDEAKEVSVFSFRIRDNPWLEDEFIRRLEREYVGMFYRRMILGEWCMAEGAIFSEFAGRNVMPRASMPAMTEWLANGVDYGTSNPFHSALLGIGPDLRAPGEQALYVTDEWRWDSRRERRQLSDVEYSERHRRWLRGIVLPGTQGDLRGVMPELVAVDPSAASYRVQLYRDGLPTVAADNEVVDSIRVASSLIAAGKLIVAEECPALLAEIPGYVWDDRAAKLGDEKPVKVDDHGIDAGLRYAPYSSRHLWHDAIWS